MSTAWEYWQPGCLSTSTDRFRKYFRIQRDSFEDIYSKAARSGKFHLNPLEPMYAELHPGGPVRHGNAQLRKVPPLCLRMAASFRRLATGESFARLSDEFRIGLSTLHKFDKQFLKWFRLTYREEEANKALRAAEEQAVQFMWLAYCTGEAGTRTWPGSEAGVTAAATAEAGTQTCSSVLE